MTNLIREINAFTILTYTTEILTIYKQKNYWDVLDKAILVVKNLCQGKSDYKIRGVFYVF